MWQAVFVAVAVAVISGIILGILGKIPSWIIKFFANLRSRWRGPNLSVDSRIILVPVPRRCHWTMGQRDGKPSMQIITNWYVTNSSDETLHLLDAALLMPNPKGRNCNTHVFTIERHEDRSDQAHSGIDMPIPPHQTGVADVSFFLDPPTQQEGTALMVQLFIVDQFGRKHSTPKVKLEYH